MPKNEPTAFDYLEATDRAHTIVVMVAELLHDHTAVIASEDMWKAFEKLEEAAQEMYQTAGRRLHKARE